MGRRESNPRTFQKLFDAAHVITCVICAGSAILLIVDLDKYSFGFPFIFLMGAVLNYFYAASRFRKDSNRNRRMGGGILFLILGIVLTAIAVLSAISLWKNS